MRRYSPYNYGLNNPIRFIDPDGMESLDFTGAAAGMAFSQVLANMKMNDWDDDENDPFNDPEDEKKKGKSNGNQQKRTEDILVAGDGGWSQRSLWSIVKEDKNIKAAGAIAVTASKSDGPLPYGEAFGAGYFLYVAMNSDILVAKMREEIDRIESKTAGPNGMTYKLVVNAPGKYTNVRGNVVNLKSLDVWKYGETTKGVNRYTNKELSNMVPGGVSMVPISFGNQMQIKVHEKTLIYGYFLTHGSLPPGNLIFR